MSPLSVAPAAARPAGFVLRDARELALMRRAGQIVAATHAALLPYIRPGVATAELDRVAVDTIRSHSAIPAFLGYHGYPAAICTSRNDEIVHGIPRPDIFLASGDLLSIDVGVIYQGWVADSGWTYPVGPISEPAQSLLSATQGALWAGIEQARSGNRLGDISAAIQTYVEARGFTIVREYGGHGVGREMHEPPQIMNYGRAGVGPLLRPGMTFALEPMVAVGAWQTHLDPDGWTVRTADGSLSAHFEHTLAITSQDPLILTLP